jgi:hypothetical protein
MRSCVKGASTQDSIFGRSIYQTKHIAIESKQASNEREYVGGASLLIVPVSLLAVS